MQFVRNSTIFFLIAVIIISSWLMGGHHYVFPYVSLFIIAGSGLGLIIALIGNKTVEVSPILLTSFFVLLGIIISGVFFHQFSEVEGTFESFYEYKNKPAYLPFGLTTDNVWEHVVILFAAILCGYLAYVGFDKRSSIRFLLWLIFINIMVLAITGTFFKITGATLILGQFEPPDPRYFFASFTYKNHWSAYATLGYLASFGLAVYYHKNRRRWNLKNSPLGIFLSLGLLVGITTIMSGSRSGFIMFCFGYGICIWISLRLLFESYTFMISQLSFVLRFILALLPIPVIIFAVYMVSPDLIREPLIVTQTQIENAVENRRFEGRVYSTRDTFKMFMARPWWGWGYQSYEVLFRKYFQGPELSATYFSDPKTKARYDALAKAVEDNPTDENQMKLQSYRSQMGLNYYKFAHNDLVQYLAEIGLFGFIALMLPLLFGFLKCITADHLSSVSKWGILGIFIILAYSFVEFPTRTPGILFLFTIVAGLTFRYNNLEIEDMDGKRRSRS